MATHSSTLAWRSGGKVGAWWAAVHGVARSRTRLSDFLFTFHFHALEKEWQPTPVFLGFPCGSAGKESAYNAGDLGWEDPLEKGKATHSSILPWRIPGNV